MAPGGDPAAEAPDAGQQVRVVGQQALQLVEAGVRRGLAGAVGLQERLLAGDDVAALARLLVDECGQEVGEGQSGRVQATINDVQDLLALVGEVPVEAEVAGQQDEEGH